MTSRADTIIKTLIYLDIFVMSVDLFVREGALETPCKRISQPEIFSTEAQTAK